jgi:hypothetical protein
MANCINLLICKQALVRVALKQGCSVRRSQVVENRHQPLTLVDPALGNDFHPQQAIEIVQLAVECMNQHEPKARPLAAQVRVKTSFIVNDWLIRSLIVAFFHFPTFLPLFIHFSTCRNSSTLPRS